MIDLRSDTVTQPTPQMRQAMAEAELGDDVFGEDPTVNQLEAMASQRMGKEAGLFVASGTMANLVSALTHCNRGDEIVVGTDAHILVNEVGGVAALGGIQLKPIPNDTRGKLDPDVVDQAIRPEGLHFPATGLICVENTHNRGSGADFTVEEMHSIAQVAHARNIPVHLDGARIFNAAIALDVDPSSLANQVDTMNFCLSKGLSCPVGSVICGDTKFINSARKVRKMLGGGMRQAGVLAAAGIVALDHMVDRLVEDHENASLLARGFSQIKGLTINPEQVQTNIVIVETSRVSALDFISALKERGVLASYNLGQRVRFVTHYGINQEDIKEALNASELALNAVQGD